MEDGINWTTPAPDFEADATAMMEEIEAKIMETEEPGAEADSRANMEDA